MTTVESGCGSLHVTRNILHYIDTYIYIHVQSVTTLITIKHERRLIIINCVIMHDQEQQYFKLMHERTLKIGQEFPTQHFVLHINIVPVEPHLIKPKW